MGRGTGEEEKYFLEVTESWGFPGGSEVKNPPTNTREAGDAVSISESGGSPGGGNGNPLQHSCLESPMDRGAWRAMVHGVHDLVIKQQRASAM